MRNEVLGMGMRDEAFEICRNGNSTLGVVSNVVNDICVCIYMCVCASTLYLRVSCDFLLGKTVLKMHQHVLSTGPSFFWNSTGNCRVHWSVEMHGLGVSLENPSYLQSISKYLCLKRKKCRISLSLSRSLSLSLSRNISFVKSGRFNPSMAPKRRKLTVKRDPISQSCVNYRRVKFPPMFRWCSKGFVHHPPREGYGIVHPEMNINESYQNVAFGRLIHFK